MRLIDHQPLVVRVLGVVRTVPLSIYHDIADGELAAISLTAKRQLSTRRQYPSFHVLGDIVRRFLGYGEEPLSVVPSRVVEVEEIIRREDDAVVLFAGLGEDHGLDHVFLSEEPINRPHQDGLHRILLDAIDERLQSFALVDAQSPAGGDPFPVFALVLDVDQDEVVGPAKLFGLLDQTDRLLVVCLTVLDDLFLGGLSRVYCEELVSRYDGLAERMLFRWDLTCW